MNDPDRAANPMGTDGFEFVEYTAPDPRLLGDLFEQLGFTLVARHRSKDVALYRQGGVNFIVNREPDSFAQSFARVHGPSACAFAIRVKNAAKAYQRALELGAKPFHGPVGPMELNIPAIRGIGDSLIYLVDRYPIGHPKRTPRLRGKYGCIESRPSPGGSQIKQENKWRILLASIRLLALAAFPFLSPGGNGNAVLGPGSGCHRVPGILGHGVPGLFLVERCWQPDHGDG